MTANDQYRAFADGHGGVRLVPKPGTPMARAQARRTRGVQFRDSFSLNSYDGLRRRSRDRAATAPMNNLSNAPYRARAPLPNEDSRHPSRDKSIHVHLHMQPDNGGTMMGDDENESPVPLDPDLLELARNASSQAIVEQIYAEQAKRDRRRQMNGNGNNGDDCYGGNNNGDRRHRNWDQQLPAANLLGESTMPDDDDDDQHQEPDGDERVIATLDPAPDGWIYGLYDQGDEVAVMLVPDTGNEEDPNLTTSDRTFRHRMFGDGMPDPVTKRMGEVARGYWAKQRATKDGKPVEQTLLRHKPLPNERLELRGPSAFGLWDLVLISPSKRARRHLRLCEKLIERERQLQRSESRQWARDEHREVISFLYDQLRFWSHIRAAGGGSR
jgi:hypothetical protein